MDKRLSVIIEFDYENFDQTTAKKVRDCFLQCAKDQGLNLSNSVVLFRSITEIGMAIEETDERNLIGGK